MRWRVVESPRVCLFLDAVSILRRDQVADNRIPAMMHLHVMVCSGNSYFRPIKIDVHILATIIPLHHLDI